MKKPFFILIAALLVSGSAGSAENSRRGLFVSMIEEPPVLSSRQKIDELIDFSKKAGIDTLFVQVYRANRSWFPSKSSDSSLYDEAFQKIGEDPLALLIRQAHASNIHVHAWMNLLSLSGNESAPLLKKYGPSILTRNREPKKELSDYKIDNQYFLEPGDARVRKELSGIVDQLLKRYPQLDGLQFDYIRYPDAHPFYGYSQENIRRFLKEKGVKAIREEDPVWKDWKRAQVTSLLESLVLQVRTLRPKIQVSTTGCLPYARAYQEALQDWPSWLDRGLINFVTVMDYSADPSEFEHFLADAKKRTKYPEKMNITVGAYKPATTPESFSKEWGICESSGCRSCVAFYYGNFSKNFSLAGALIETS